MSAILANQLLMHVSSAHHILESSDFSLFKLWDGTAFVQPSDIFRKGNDILASTYCHLIPLSNPSGYDAIGLDGSGYELKLAYVDIHEYEISSEDNLVRKESKNTLDQTISGHYKVYPSTSSGNYQKDTILVLVSKVHRKFISAFFLSADDIPKLLTTSDVVQKKISLAKFRQYGKEISSCVPNFGFDNFIDCSKRFLKNEMSLEDYLTIPTKQLPIIS